MNDLYLQHHGILGQKWGVRRYQNADGTLTEAGKKRVSSQYKKENAMAVKDMQKNYNHLYFKAYNEAATEMNNGGIEAFNKSEEKKYGAKYTEREQYIDDYEDYFNEKFEKYMKETVRDFEANNTHMQKAKELVDKYAMLDWDEFALKTEQDRKSYYSS